MGKYLFIMFLLLGARAWASVPTISEFTGSMQHHDGFIPFYYDKQTDKVYLKLSQFEQPLLFQTSLPQGLGSNDIGLDRGQLGDTRLIEFERYGNKVLMKQLNTRYRANSDNLAEQASIDEAFTDSVIAGFVISAKSDNAVVIDYTPFLLSDVHGISQRLEDTGQGDYKVDPARSGVYLSRSKGFEKNTELEALITLGGSKAGDYVSQVAPDEESLSVHLHHSFVELPPEGYSPRVYHPYSGFWKFSYLDYATAITDPMEQKYIIRHRLNKKDPTANVSEAVEPIVYYLDPGIPEPVMSALKDGASWWNEAFEAIGYKNAFQVKVLPEDADPMDVRYNVIQWVHRATRGWSYGASVVDPRTGELIKGHVTLGSLRVRQDYLIALGLTSPFDEKAKTDTQPQLDMALARIRQLSAHEVGHTLGIAHNFAASENDRASVMDYPHPLINLNNGNISLQDAYTTGIGAWDKHAIAYGYQDYASEAKEFLGLAGQIASAREANLKYKTDADTRASYHASSSGHMWDNGNDPLAGFEQITAIRTRALKRLGLNSLAPETGLSALEDVLVPIYLLHRYQLEAVAKQVGGIHYEYERKGDYTDPRGQQEVASATQKKAIQQLLSATTPEFLALPDDLLRLIIPTIYGDDITREHFESRMGRMFDPVTAAESAAAFSLSLLLEPQRLNRLAWQSQQVRGVPDVSQLISRIFETHWYNPDTPDHPLTSRLQLTALNAVMKTLQSDTLAPEAKIAIETSLIKFNQWLDKKSKHPGKRVLTRHLETYWQSGEWPAIFDAKPLPPGSPI